MNEQKASRFKFNLYKGLISSMFRTKWFKQKKIKLWDFRPDSLVGFGDRILEFLGTLRDNWKPLEKILRYIYFFGFTMRPIKSFS